jgi:hypothetical protein
MARFHVRDTFAIHDKKTFVLAGFAIEGEITTGMLIRLPFKDNVMITARIDHIEQVRRPDGDVVCLCLGCAEPREIALWEAMNIRDRMVDIIRAG